MFKCLQLLFFLLSHFAISLPLQANSKPTAINITIVGSVFCDSCSEHTFSKRSYFLQGARVQIQCRFTTKSALRKDTLITAERTTDRYGVYKLDVPSVDGFRCGQGRQMTSPCRAILIESPSSLCNLTGHQMSTTHVAVKPIKTSMCILNMNALNYRPSKRDVAYCGLQNRPLSAAPLDSSLFLFWPLIPPFLIPWLHWPPLPFTLPPLPFPFNIIPLPDPSSLPFLLPPWLVPFLNPSSLPFPFSLFPPLAPAPPLSASPPYLS